jgi:hypothetical protein
MDAVVENQIYVSGVISFRQNTLLQPTVIWTETNMLNIIYIWNMQFF